MKKAFALILLLALVLTGCGIPADVPDPTENSYPLHPTTTTQAEATTVPAETESELNELDTTKETEAATEPTVPSTSEPTAEATNPTEGSQEATPPKQTEPHPTEPENPVPETTPTRPTEPETEPTQPPTESIIPPTEPPETEPTEPVETEPTGCSQDWECVHHAEEGHWRAGVVCDCGWTAYGSADELIALWNAHSASYPAAESLFDHGGYGCVDEWIVDKPAYDEWVCRLCGEKKE